MLVTCDFEMYARRDMLRDADVLSILINMPHIICSQLYYLDLHICNGFL